MSMTPWKEKHLQLIQQYPRANEPFQETRKTTVQEIEGLGALIERISPRYSENQVAK